jgi:hypothetical protein
VVTACGLERENDIDGRKKKKKKKKLPPKNAGISIFSFLFFFFFFLVSNISGVFPREKKEKKKKKEATFARRLLFLLPLNTIFLRLKKGIYPEKKVSLTCFEYYLWGRKKQKIIFGGKMSQIFILGIVFLNLKPARPFWQEESVRDRSAGHVP